MRRADAQGGGEEGLKRRQSVLELPGVSQLHRYTQMGVEVIAMVAAFDIRRPTTVVRHSTADSRLLNVGRRLVVGRRMANVVLWKDPATTQERADTTQENAGTTQEKTGTTQENAVKDAVTTEEVAPKTGEVALKVAPKNGGVALKVAPKTGDVAPNVAPKDGEATPQKGEQEVCQAVNAAFPTLRDGIAEKCAKMYVHMRDYGGSNSSLARELDIPLRSIIRYQEILKQAHVLEHAGPANGGVWKFLM